MREETLDRTPWRTGILRGYGPAAIQTTEWIWCFYSD